MWVLVGFSLLFGTGWSMWVLVDVSSFFRCGGPAGFPTAAITKHVCPAIVLGHLIALWTMGNSHSGRPLTGPHSEHVVQRCLCLSLLQCCTLTSTPSVFRIKVRNPSTVATDWCMPSLQYNTATNSSPCARVLLCSSYFSINLFTILPASL